ncbi:methionine synthase [Chloroflexota bacterium]
MSNKEFGCLPTIIGTMPHTDAAAACRLITHYLPDIPAWPQLPRSSFRENMNAQFSQGFPGLVVTGDSISVDRSGDLDKPLEQLYAAYLENDADKYPIGPEYAAGLHYFLGLKDLSPRAVKGQLTGPITWGLTVTDDSRRAVLYDDVLGDAVARFLKLKVAWQEKKLREVCPETIIFVDEPYMSAYGSVGFMLPKERVISLLEEVFSGISGLKGIHCCGNTDWSLILETSTDIVSFDAYNYAASLSLYPEVVRSFLGGKGVVAWGIIPSDEVSLAGESVASLKDRLEEAMAPFTRNGIRFEQLVAQGLLTPSCGLATLTTEDAAARALELLAELSREIRKRYR